LASLQKSVSGLGDLLRVWGLISFLKKMGDHKHDVPKSKKCQLTQKLISTAEMFPLMQKICPPQKTEQLADYFQGMEMERDYDFSVIFC
jgi:hypothetical protein